MKPAPFEMVRPRALAEVLELLSSHHDAKLLAGGQSLVPLMNLRMATPALLIDLGQVGGLTGISVVDGELRIGAMTRQKDLFDHPLVESYAPLVAAAMPHVGHVQTRNRGTVGGSLAHADPAAELPLVVAALNGRLIAQSRGGVREIPGHEFFVDALTTALAPDELLTEIRLPSAPEGARIAFREFARRHGDFAIAAAAVQFSRLEDGIELKAALGGVGSIPHACRELNEAFAAGTPGPECIAKLIEHEIALLQPQSDLQASAEFRRHLARVALTECLRKVVT
jgi:2-furoyl-CoA dehydrogenase FAD binding subunit